VLLAASSCAVLLLMLLRSHGISQGLLAISKWANNQKAVKFAYEIVFAQKLIISK
jgi:hypothetical protein